MLQLPGVLQLPIGMHIIMLQLPIGMHIITLQLPMVCYKNTRISQNALMQQVKQPLLIKACHIDIDCGFELLLLVHCYCFSPFLNASSWFKSCHMLLI